ncbi:hypothetical protein LCGC14_1884430 [marine sediment metagenome]|uniref:Beta-phosphoglucomutase n=1 Tax=marine sediment metagenome TaxID=412755 RepID=A0A0F9IF92_9ZZZZ
MKDEGKTNSDWAVIFDVDGTMVDNAKFHEGAWIEFGRRHDLPIDGEYYRKNIHSRSNDINIRKLLGEDTTDANVEKFGDEKESIYRQTFGPVAKEIAGLKVLLDSLKQQGVKCAAASNSPRGNVDLVLDKLDIRNYFDVIIDNDQVNIGKPDPEIFFMTAQKLAIPPDRCVIVEDSISGFKAAENAEMAYIVITAGADSSELKFAKHAKAIHQDFTAITPEYLERLL